MSDFHTIRANHSDYLLFLQAKVNLIASRHKDLRNNGVFHIIITEFINHSKDYGLGTLKNIEEES